MSKASILFFAPFVATISASVLPRQDVGSGVIRPGSHSFLAVGGSFADAVSPSGQPILCNNITTGAAARCWTVLNLTEYISNFTSLSKEYCSPQQTFDNCLLNKVYSENTRVFFSQSNITRNECAYFASQCPQPLATAKSWTPTSYYVALTFYNVYQYTYAWANAISSSASSQSLSSVIDLTKPAATNLQTIISKYGNNTATSKALNTLLSAGETQPVSNALAGTGSTLGTSLESAIPVLSRRLGDALKKAMTSPEAFYQLVGDNGIFSGNLSETGLPPKKLD